MARYTGPVCRLCRREKMKLYLKGAKCDTMRCPIERRPTPPGEHGRDRLRQGSEYNTQLREKQKARRIYGVLEQQFVNLYDEANRQQGITGENLLLMLERRLDNAVYRMGLASSRAAARQLVRHGHIQVSGRKVNIPSFAVAPGQEIALRESSRNMAPVLRSLDLSGGRNIPPWLQFDREGMKAKVISLPKREDVNFPIQEQMVVELYSK